MQDESDSVTFEQLDAAIVAGLRAKLPAGVHVDAYPEVPKRIRLPAVVIEMDEFEPGDDPGTGQTAVVCRYQARAIVDPNDSDAPRQVRALAGRIAAALNHANWDLPVSVANFVQAGADHVRPELDGYLVWLVEWTHEIHMGDSEWPYPDSTGKEVLLGIYPETGAGRADRYWPLGADIPPDFGEAKV